MEGLEEVIVEFMQEQYLYTPDRRAIQFALDAGLDIILENIGFESFFWAESSIKRNKITGLVAKIFALAYPFEKYGKGWDNKQIRDWSAWLAESEYMLATEYTLPEESRQTLFGKALEHLEESYRRGNATQKLFGYRGDINYHLGNYEEALAYMIKSRDIGNTTKTNESLIGSCYMKLRRFEEGLQQYQRVIEMAQQGEFDYAWAKRFKGLLEDALSFFASKRAEVEHGAYGPISNEFQRVYSAFIVHWQANTQDRAATRMPQAAFK